LSQPPVFTIIGGGPAGLAAAYFARKRQISFSLYEAAPHVGGNARTLQWGPFRYDTGAHRFHDKDAQVTREIKSLLGDDLQRVVAPSQIYHEGQLVDFPFRPLNLLQRIGAMALLRGGVELVLERLNPARAGKSFSHYARQRYGRSIAERFLFNYSSKLWGLPAERLSPAISGKRLQGLGLATVLVQALNRRGAGGGHLEGAFYYPRQGYGAIVEALGQAGGWENIHLKSPITAIRHAGQEVRELEIDGRQRVPVREVISSLPLPLLVGMLEPPAEGDVLAHTRKLRFRNMVLLAIFLDRPRMSPNASVYFPDPGVPFTRLYEPKNRSPEMAPVEQTVVCVEFPCFPEDTVWSAHAGHLVELVLPVLEPLGWMDKGQILGLDVVRMANAYPVLEVGHERHVGAMLEYLERFRNLHIMGRNGLFRYVHVHDLMRAGMDLVASLAGGPSRVQRAGGRG